MIEFSCKHCGQKFETEEEYAGQIAECALCGKNIKIPTSEESEKFKDNNLSQKEISSKWKKYLSIFIIILILFICLAGVYFFFPVNKKSTSKNKSNDSKAVELLKFKNTQKEIPASRSHASVVTEKKVDPTKNVEEFSGEILYKKGINLLLRAEYKVAFNSFLESKTDKAQKALIFCYKNGIGTPKNMGKVLECYKSLVKKGDITAQYQIAEMYNSGDDIPKNIEEAIKWYKRGYSKGNIECVKPLVQIYLNKKEFNKAFIYCCELAQEGFPGSLFCLARMYEKGEGTERDINKAVHWYKLAVKKGNTRAMFRLSKYYMNGKYLKKDTRKAFELCSKVASQDVSSFSSYIGDAQKQLSTMYRKGIGVKEDLNKALKWHNKARSQKTYELANNYEYGCGVKKNLNKAFDLYYKVASAGAPKAKAKIAFFYRFKKNNDSAAREWHKKAFQGYEKKALNGDVDAMLETGRCYYFGSGVKKDLNKAAEWYKKVLTKNSEIILSYGIDVFSKSEALIKLGEISYCLGKYNDAYNCLKKGIVGKCSTYSKTDALFMLGVMNYYGQGVKENKEKAKEYWVQCLQTCPNAHNNYKAFWKIVLEPDIEDVPDKLYKAFVICNRLDLKLSRIANYYAKKIIGIGDSKSLLRLACTFELDKNMPRAMRLFEKAAEKGNEKARRRLVYIYSHDKKLRNCEKAFKFVAKDGKATLKSLALYFAYSFQKGEDDFSYSPQKAIKWYKKAAELGDSGACYLLGLFYSEGRMTSKDNSKAFYWYKKAAELGDSGACYLLGLFYSEGRMTSKDNSKAFYWYKKATLRRHIAAICDLADSYLFGKGVPENYVQAYAWYSLYLSKVKYATLSTTPQKLLGKVNLNIKKTKKRVLNNIKFLKRQMNSYQIGQAQDLALKLERQIYNNEGNNQRMGGSGTGFFIANNGYILTNYHVIEGAKGIKVKTRNNLYNATLVGSDLSNDLGLLKISTSKVDFLNFSSKMEAKIGQKVFTVGFPRPSIQGFYPKYTEGIISSLRGLHDNSGTYQISVPVQPGNSGGVLADQQGKIVGVVVSKLNDKFIYEKTGHIPQNVNYAIKGAYILAFLNAIPDISKKIKTGNDKSLSKEQAIEKVKKATVMILTY